MTRKRKPGKNGRSISNVDLPPVLDEPVCLYGDVQPDEDDPTRGTCTNCGGEFDLRDGARLDDFGTTDESRDEPPLGSNGHEGEPSDADGDVR